MQQTCKRILVVDQSRTIQILLRTHFGNAGYQVLTCSTPGEAFRAFTGLRQAPPDVVFLALDEREESYKVINYMKEQGAYSHTSLVVMVLAEEKAGIQRKLGMPDVHYLIKPFQIQEALALVNNGSV